MNCGEDMVQGVVKVKQTMPTGMLLSEAQHAKKVKSIIKIY
jgi:hypothetical protein